MMKKTITKTAMVITLALTLGLALSSCKKEGPAGPAGPAGANGTNGTNGTNGNANVVSSSITSSNWVYSAPKWQISFTYPAITQDIIDNGAVLVYVKAGAGYNQIPITIYPTSSYSRTYEVGAVVGSLTVFVTDSDLTQPANPGSQTFKVVVIAASGRAANPNVNYNNYNEVKATFHLAD